MYLPSPAAALHFTSKHIKNKLKKKENTTTTTKKKEKKNTRNKTEHEI